MKAVKRILALLLCLTLLVGCGLREDGGRSVQHVVRRRIGGGR